jgi:phospholipid/cholesterol/gamma-HCH transport system permease protein
MMELREFIRALRSAGGPQAVFPVVVMMGAIGGIAALQGVTIMRMFGVERLLAGMLTEVTLRDLAPTMTALMLAAQVGTAMAGEIGAMRVTDESDALRVMGVDPWNFLAVPRIAALTLMTPIVAGLGGVAALAAGYAGAVYAHGASAGPFIASLADQVSAEGVLEGAWKATVFGFLCAFVACKHGMAARGGSEGVGRAVNAAIVQSIILIGCAEAILTALLMRVTG